jgi:pimeloyl-ACP methyl ester carboxylesterase
MKKRLLQLTLTMILLTLMATPCVLAGQGNMVLKTIEISRGDFAYRESGNPTGFPVIMLHGWPESSYCWNDVAANMDPSLRIIAPDLRGLGDSERTMDATLYQKKELAKDIIELVNALGINSFNLVGHDWGGVVAQEVAIAIPQRVNQMVIMNIHIIVNLLNNLAARDILYSQGATSYWYQYFQQRPNNLAEEMIPNNEAAWISQFFINRPVPQQHIDEYIKSYKIKDTPATGASYYRAMVADGQRWYELFLLFAGYVDGTPHKFSMPTLYIYGNLDTVVIPAYLTGIEAWFNSIQVVQLEAAHFVQEEKPVEVAQLLNIFFMAP